LVPRLREKADDIGSALFEQIDTPDRKWLSDNGGNIGEVPKVICAVLDHCFSAIEGDEDRPVPPEAINHARALAWTGCGTDVLQQRYIDCKVVFMEHLRQADLSVKPRSDAGCAAAQRRTEQVFCQLLRVVCREHRAERRRRSRSRSDRDLERVRQLLFGELTYPPEDLGYDFSATHIGVVGSGPGAEDEIRRLAQMLGGETLIVQATPAQVWAWIGLRRQSSSARVDDILKAECDPGVFIARGEPIGDLDGWRHSHQEAEAAVPIAIHRPGSVVRYAEVSVLASIASDPVLQRSVRTQFLDPLTRGRDGGRRLLKTLQTYFAHDRNGLSTSKALGVSRQTITNNLRQAEEYLGRSITACGIGLEAAVLFAELTS
jgi:hypothetical protein